MKGRHLNIHDLKTKTARWNHFHKVDLLGAFDFYTTIVSFDALSAADLNEVKKHCSTDLRFDSPITPKQYEALAKVLPLAAHEYTHFVDATSSIWGLGHLNLMNDAYLADDRRGGKELDFAKAKAFYDHVRSIRLPDYYTVVNENADDRQPWKSTISIGQIFSRVGEPSTRPVLFSRFANAKDELLARSPISTVSLLEASAMAQELFMQGQLISHCESDFKQVEWKQFTQRLLGYLYRKDVTEYSVCVHVLANKLNCTDIASAFQLCALLTRIALNFTDELFDSIAGRAPIAEILQLPRESPFIASALAGLRQRDRGILFYLLCNALPADSHNNPKPQAAVRAAANFVGFEIDMLRESARREAKRLASSLISSEIRPIQALARAGLANFYNTDFDQAPLRFNQMHLPPAVLGDSSELQVFGGNGLADFDVSACFDELFFGQSWVERFAEACL